MPKRHQRTEHDKYANKTFTAPTTDVNGITLTVGTVRALLSHAADEGQWGAVGIPSDDGGQIMATDGHRLISICMDKPVGEIRLGTGWGREHVAELIGVARALKSTTVTLLWSASSDHYPMPPINEVLPKRVTLAASSVSVCLDPAYLADLGKACADLGRGVVPELDPVPTALDPVRAVLYCGDDAAPIGDVVIMPRRRT